MNTSNSCVARIVNKVLLLRKPCISRLSVENQTIHTTKANSSRHCSTRVTKPEIKTDKLAYCHFQKTKLPNKVLQPQSLVGRRKRESGYAHDPATSGADERGRRIEHAKEDGG
jgi:hypothetical protein